MELTPVRPTAKAPPSNVTGDIYVNAIFRGYEPLPMTVSVVRMQARLPWRCGGSLQQGPNGQLLGVARCVTVA
jgi:hypothetical protein